MKFNTLALSITLILLSCSAKEKYTNTYPPMAFSKVKLFSLKPALYKIEDVSYLQDSVMKSYPEGLIFIDTLGTPFKDNYIEKELDEKGVPALLTLLSPAPQIDSEHMTKMCIPIFRDCIVFYNALGSPVAHINLCFQCEMASLWPYSENIADFDNAGRWNNLREFFASYGINASHIPLPPNK